MKQFTAIFARDDNDTWLVSLAEEPRAHTFGRTIEAARAAIRDLAALWFELDEEEFAIAEQYDLDEETQRAVAEVTKARAAVEHASEVAKRAMADACERLTRKGLSRRDVASVVGVSGGRVQQILAERSD